MKKTFKVNFRRDASWMSRMSRLSCVISLAFACALQAATVHKAPLKGLLIDNASVVTDVTGLGSATRLETADGRTWIDAAGNVGLVKRKAVFNGMEAVSGDDPAGTVGWMFYDDGENGYCSLEYGMGSWRLCLARLEDVENADGGISQEMVAREWSATAPWGTQTLTLNGDWGTETVQLSFVTGIVNRIAFTNDVPKIDFSKIPTLTTNDVCAIVTNEVVEWTAWKVYVNGEYKPGWSARIDTWEGDEQMAALCITENGKYLLELTTGTAAELTSWTEYSSSIDYVDSSTLDYLIGSTIRAKKETIIRNALGLAKVKDLEKLPTHETVTNVARAVVNSVWDASLGVAWEARMHNGHLYYIAVTNRPPEVK